MSQKSYPSVDIQFIEENVVASGLLEDGGILKIGSTTSFIKKGNSNKAVYKRTTLVRELEPGQICFEQAMALALKFDFLGALLEWFEENRDWKEGAYIVPKAAQNHL